MATAHKFKVFATGGADAPDLGHHSIDTVKDGKNVRINSRDVAQATGDHSGVQIKPNKSVDGTGGMTGLEVSPRFAASMGGSDLRAILADPVLKAGSGNLSGSVKGVEVNIDFGISGTRTITGDVSAFETFLAVPSTYTYSGKLSVIKVRDENIKKWDYLLNLQSTGVGVLDTTAGTYSTANGFLKVRIGSTDYRIPVFTGVD